MYYYSFLFLFMVMEKEKIMVVLRGSFIAEAISFLERGTAASQVHAPRRISSSFLFIHNLFINYYGALWTNRSLEKLLKMV